MLDAELFLPESWSKNRPRCREAGIPDEMVYRLKWEIALEQYERAITNGVNFEWLTFDEGSGSKGPFSKALSGRGQKYVAELPVTMIGWLTPPKVTSRRSQ